MEQVQVHLHIHVHTSNGDDVKKLRRKFKRLTARVDIMSQKSDQLEGMLATANTKIDTLQGRVDTVQSTFAEAGATMLQRIEELKALQTPGADPAMEAALDRAIVAAQSIIDKADALTVDVDATAIPAEPRDETLPG